MWAICVLPEQQLLPTGRKCWDDGGQARGILARQGQPCGWQGVVIAMATDVQASTYMEENICFVIYEVASWTGH